MGAGMGGLGLDRLLPARLRRAASLGAVEALGPPPEGAGGAGEGGFRASAPAAGAAAPAAGGPAPGETRETFANYAEFLLVNVGYAVGLGNFIIFPGRVYENGGGAFLIAYFLALFLLGVPIFCLELKLGQYFQRGNYHALTAAHPRFWAVGFAGILQSFIVMHYYNVLIAWALVYFGYSFVQPLPWAGDSEGFFYDTVLNISSGIGDTGAVNWKLLLANGGAWVLMALILCKGVESIGKAAYVMVILPYLCIITLLVKGLTLEGSDLGVRAYMQVDMSQLGRLDTWVRAAGQIFFSVGVAFGGLTTFASYQPRSNNYVRDSFLVPTINCLTSFVAGFAIYAVLGSIAVARSSESGEGPATVDGVQVLGLSGFQLAFVAYSEGLAQFGGGGGANFFSCLFFLTLIALGVDSQVGNVETVVTFIKDSGLPLPRWLIGVVVCITGFLLSIPMVCDSGYFWVTLLWDFGNYLSMFAISGLTMVLVGWVLGPAWVQQASQEMRGTKMTPIFPFFWRFVDPIICAALFIIGTVALVPYPSTLGQGSAASPFPTWAQVFSIVINYGPTALMLLALAVPARYLPFIPKGRRRSIAADSVLELSSDSAPDPSSGQSCSETVSGKGRDEERSDAADLVQVKL